MNNLGELKTAILSWINREDQQTQDILPTIIRLAESDIYRDLRTRENEFVAEYDNTATVQEYTELPQNFREMKLVTWEGRPLEEVSVQHIKRRIEDGRYDPEPRVFALQERKILFSQDLGDPADWDTSVLQYTYYGSESLNDLPTWQTPTNPVTDPVSEQTVTPLSQTDSNTNRILQVHPKVYLFSCLYHVHLFLQMEQEAAAWEARYGAAVAEINMADATGALTGSTVAVTSVYHDGSYLQ